mmetsp:Transcript_44351/g.50082  ORF Transcript_44351/g.50082 Transcript_44351/m.50082 type:complete len:549 (-) Transcript_44351:23-1669(-)
MKLVSAATFLRVLVTTTTASTGIMGEETVTEFGDLPPKIGDDGSNRLVAWTEFVEGIFPTWCIDDDEQRILDGVGDTCADGSKNGRWDPLYLTKWHGGEDPAFGGYPTDIDTRYPFYYGSGFFGQACAGGNSHCSFDFDGSKNNCAKCGKIVTLDHDNGPNGPGHVPPHIGLASLTRAYHLGGFGDVKSWFDYEQNGCRVMPNVLLRMIRKYFPRNEDGTNAFPPPFTEDGGPGSPDGTNYPYPLEFVNLVGDSCDKEKEKFPSAECYEQHSGNKVEYPTYLKPGHGSPHYCSVGAMDADVNKDWCPYIFFGPNRGAYRHPHIAYSAVETWLANKVMPEKCFKTWDENDGKDYPFTPNDNSVAFPKMAKVDGHEDDPKQPSIKKGSFLWPGDEGTKKKAVPGVFVIDKYLTPTTIGTPLPGCPSTQECKGDDEKLTLKGKKKGKKTCATIKEKDLCNEKVKKAEGKKEKASDFCTSCGCGGGGGSGDDDDDDDDTCVDTKKKFKLSSGGKSKKCKEIKLNQCDEQVKKSDETVRGLCPKSCGDCGEDD